MKKLLYLLLAVLLLSCKTYEPEKGNPPIFDKTFYNFSVISSTVAGTEIGSVSASHPDGDEITYSMTTASQQFALNGSTGVITVKTGGNLTETLYSLTVQAVDPGQNTATVSVNITNSQPPVFDKTLYSFTVASSAVVGAEIGSVSASNPNGDKITYSLAATSQQFALDSSTGVITVKTGGNLTETSYRLTVQAVDPQQNTTTISVNITISQSFAFDKTFYNFSVVSSTVAGTEIGSVSASDPDGDEITYSMAAASQQFALNGSTGVITVKTSGNLTETFYSLSVKASGNTEAVTVLINITDITDMVTKTSGMFVEIQVSTGEVHVSVTDGDGFSPAQHGGRITKIYLDNTDKGSLVQLDGFGNYDINGVQISGGNTTGYINHVIRHNDGIFFTSTDNSPVYTPGRSNWVVLDGRPFTREVIAFAAWMQLQNVLIVSSLENKTVISATDGRPVYCEDILDPDEFIPLCGELDDYIAYSGVGINNIVFVGAIDSHGARQCSHPQRWSLCPPYHLYIFSRWFHFAGNSNRGGNCYRNSPRQPQLQSIRNQTSTNGQGNYRRN